VLVAGGILVGAVAVVLALTSLGSSSSSSPPSAASSTTAARSTTKHKTTTHSQAPAKPAVPANAAETSVAVLNGTETTGLAHRVSGQLQQVGYSQAAALNGHPPGLAQTTVVEYTGGHQSDAEGVAHVLGVSQVQPMEAAVTPLVGSASVAVVVGADKATGQ